MALAARLQLRQSQSLVMTPQLMQSIRLLQLTHLELERFIDEEIERNPLIERAAANTDEPVAEDRHVAEAGDVTDFDRDIPLSAEAMSAQLDASLENVFPDDPGTVEHLDPTLSAQWRSATGTGGAGGTGLDGLDLDAIASAGTSLHEHVNGQIALAFRDRVERVIAGELCEALDDNGYLTVTPDEIASRLGVEPDLVSAVLAQCQGLEPAGIFASGLAECLTIQLKARDRFDPAMRVLIENLPMLARRDFDSLRRLCVVDEADLLDMLAEIKALDPRPGLAFSGGAAEIIVPDVLVRAASDGSWLVELNPDVLPRVLVDQSYYAQVSRHARAGEEKAFLTECLQSANWLARSLDQRARTIIKVATEVVRQQDAFLVHGVRHLRPLNLKTVADAIGMHESTVSRVTANKYMLTPRGMFELRYFFTAAIASAEGGDAHSSEAVRDRIRQLIDEESPANVLSDDAIVDMLRATGVDIARRTVAKYREGMSIPSSVERRREKRARARQMA